MPDYFVYILFLLLFFVLEILYFKISKKYQILDIPNERSSHQKFTIRGGGIIFPIAALSWFLISGFPNPFFILGLVIISIISFIDDIEHIHTKVRFMFQLFAVALMLYQVPVNLEWFFFPIIFILLVGTINAYNFMDGINGITGLYSISTLISLLYVNSKIAFTSNRLLILCLLALLVFGYFNFRRRARTFAGDIGSVSIAFTICYLLLTLVAETDNFIYVLFLLFYGLDAASTMLFRALRRENLLEAHRTHFYQFLANEKKWPHLGVALLYAGGQLVTNYCLVSFTKQSSNMLLTILIIFISAIIFIALRFFVEGKKQLIDPA